MRELELLTEAERAYREIIALLGAAGEKLGVTGEQLLFLARMSHEPVRMNALLRTAYLGTNVTYNVKRLEEKGFITRATDPHDLRAAHISRTRKGDEAASTARGIIVDAVRERLTALQAIAA